MRTDGRFSIIALGVALGVLTLPAVLLAQGRAPSGTVDDIVERHVTARGGRAALAALETVRMTGRLRLGPESDEAHVVIELKRPNKMRMDMTVDGVTGSQAFDGTRGWAWMPFAGMEAPEALPPDVAAEARTQADFDGPLVDHVAKGHRVAVVGREQRDGRDVYRLRLSLAAGGERDIFISAVSWLETGSETRRTLQGATVVAETRQGDEREAASVKFPGYMETGLKGMPGTQRLEIDRIEVNVPIDDSRFVMPDPR